MPELLTDLMASGHSSSNILIVSNFFPPRTVGGAEVVAYRQAKALAAKGHKITILAGDVPNEEAPAGTLNLQLYEGLRVYRIAMRSLDPDQNFFWPAAARRMRAIIAADEIETVHFHNVMGLGANLIVAAKDSGARCIVTLHDHWGFCFRQTRLRTDGSLCNHFEECAKCMPAIQPPQGTAVPIRLRRDYVAWCLESADLLITPSVYLAEAYKASGIPEDRLRVISNGIDLSSLPDRPKEPAQDGTVRFLCSAYLGEHKGIPVLLEAIRRMASDNRIGRPWQVTIAGEGHLRGEIEKAVASPLGQHLRFAGRVPRNELLQLMYRTDVAVLPSIWPENEPVTMLEAIASGTAQIATRIGGNPELVDEPNSGTLVTPGDPNALGEAMLRYIVDPALAHEQGSYNRRRRAKFDESNTISKLDEIVTETEGVSTAQRGNHPVVICGTGRPPVEASALASHAHEYLEGTLAPRLIWREWADERVWRYAVLLWLWDRHPEEWLVNRALSQGIPVLAATNAWAEGLARHYGGVILYQTFLEALAAMRTLLAIAPLRREFAWRSLTAAGSATVMAPTKTFSLVSEAGQ